jgi:DNA-binding protein HU-beta
MTIQAIAACHRYRSDPADGAGRKTTGGTVPAKFTLSKEKSGKFKFSLLAPNGQVIATSQDYSTKASALNGVASLRKNAPAATLDDQTVVAAAAKKAAAKAPAKKVAAKAPARRAAVKRSAATKAVTKKAVARKAVVKAPATKATAKTTVRATTRKVVARKAATRTPARRTAKQA